MTFYAELIAKYKNLICLGDFNVHINDQSDVGAQSFSDSMYAMGLDQHVDVPTHKHGNTLDLIITESVSSFGICKTAYCNYISDHKMVYVILTVDKDQISSTKTKERSFDDFDLERFKIDVGNIKLPDETIDSKVAFFEKRICNILDKMAPFEEKTRIVRPKKIWFDETAKEKKRFLRSRERVYNKYRAEHQWIALKEARNDYIKYLNTNRQEELSEQVLSMKGDTKKLYKLVNSITNSVKENPMPYGKTDNELADSFANFFMEKVEKITDELKGFPHFEPSEKNVLKLSDLKPLTTDELKVIISDLQTKTCENDVIKTGLLKKCLDLFIPSISVNSSLREGCFPSKWKESIIRPLIKKSNGELVESNYRPVSNLTFLNKVVVEAFLLRFDKHCESEHLMPVHQSAYRQHHSCETSLCNVVNELLGNMENGRLSNLL